MSARRVLAAVCLAWWCAACTASPQEQRVSLCEDLGNLAETVGLLGSPPEDATVGDLRGAVEKLDPTIAQAEDAAVLPEPAREGLRDAQEAVLDALSTTGDDTDASGLTATQDALVDALVSRFDGVVVTLGCADVAG